MKKMVFVLVLTAGVGVFPATAFGAGCFDDAAACFQQAATRDTFMGRTLAGLDCELNLIECSRRKILGR
jgi:hypothetical protein